MHVHCSKTCRINSWEEHHCFIYLTTWLQIWGSVAVSGGKWGQLRAPHSVSRCSPFPRSLQSREAARCWHSWGRVSAGPRHVTVVGTGGLGITRFSLCGWSSGMLPTWLNSSVFVMIPTKLVVWRWLHSVMWLLSSVNTSVLPFRSRTLVVAEGRGEWWGGGMYWWRQCCSERVPVTGIGAAYVCSRLDRPINLPTEDVPQIPALLRFALEIPIVSPEGVSVRGCFLWGFKWHLVIASKYK